MKNPRLLARIGGALYLAITLQAFQPKLNACARTSRARAIS
jgi:hypothetical protein